MIRRLADAPRLVVLVATIGIAQVLLLVALLLPDVFEGGFFPPLLDWTWTASPDLLVQGREWSVLDRHPRARAGAGGVPHPHPHGPDGARVGGEPRQGAPGGHPRCSAPPTWCGRSRPRSPRSPRSRWRRCAGSASPVRPRPAARSATSCCCARWSSRCWRGCGRCRWCWSRASASGIVEVILQQNVDPSDLGRHRAVAVRGDARDRARVLPPLARHRRRRVEGRPTATATRTVDEPADLGGRATSVASAWSPCSASWC